MNLLTPRKKKKVSKLSVVVSFVFHGLIIGLLAYMAAKEGYLGKELKTLAVTMTPKEKPKPVEKPKEKPPEQKPKEPEKVDQHPVEQPKLAAAPAPSVQSSAPIAAPLAAPAAVDVPDFQFDGGKAVATTSDPHALYKGYMEYELRSHWDRPEGVNDDKFVAEVSVKVSSDGSISDTVMEKTSGNTAWDNSVKRALQQTPSIGRPPPKGFPPQVTIRFDVALTEQSVIQ
jgi:TonB family protein